MNETQQRALAITIISSIMLGISLVVWEPISSLTKLFSIAPFTFVSIFSIALLVSFYLFVKEERKREDDFKPSYVQESDKTHTGGKDNVTQN